MTLTLLVILLYFGIIFSIGFYVWRRSNTFESFTVANRSLSFPLLVVTVVATFYGSSAIIGGVGLSYVTGLGVLWFMVPFYIGNLALIVFLKKIKESDALTLPDFLGKFYGSKVVATSAILVGIFCLVPESIIGAGKILTLVSPLSLEYSMILVASIVTIYTIMGGMRSVVYSDLFQFFLMVAGMGVLVFFAIGYSPDFATELPSEYFNPFAYIGLQESVLWCILLFFLPITRAPLYQRFFSSNPKVSIKKVLILSVLIWVFVDLAIVVTGLVASTNFVLDDPDFALLELAKNVLPPAFQALFFVGLLSAIMSTADSFLHTGGTTLAHDFLGKLTKLSDRKLLQLSRLFIVLLAVISLISALIFQEIIPALIFFLSVWISAMVMPTLSALLGRKLKERTAVLCILVGAILTVAWKIFPMFGIEPLFVGITASFIIAVVGR